MKRIAVLIAVFAAVMAILNLIACPIPYSAAQALPAVDSPLPTPSLELTPPHRPTPTQGPPPQPDSEPPGGVVRDDPRPTPVTRGIVTEMEPAAIEPAPLPVWAREIVALIRTLVWPAWKWDTLE